MTATTTAPPTPPRRLPAVLPFAVVGAILYLILSSLGGLLNQVQLATGTFGAMESLASGFGPGMVDRTQSLLATWTLASADPRTHDLIVWTARAYTIVDTLFLVMYATVLVRLWQRVRLHLPAGAGGDPTTRNRLRRTAYWRRGPILAVAAAVADATENALRQVMVERAVAGVGVPDWLIQLSWAMTTAKLVLVVSALVLLVVLLHDTGLLVVWARRTSRALWRLRIVVVAVGLYLALLLADPTGQAIDLARRWVDDATSLWGAVLVFAGSLLLGLAAWLYARRVVLSDQTQRPSRLPWTPVLIVFAVLTAAGGLLGWRQLYAFTALAVIILIAGWWLFRTPLTAGASQAEVTAAATRRRSADAAKPEDDDVRAVRRSTRALAVAPPITVLMLTATAYAQVMVVLPLSGQQHSDVFLLAIGFVAASIIVAPVLAVGLCALVRRWDGEVDETPKQLETRYIVGGLVVLVITVSSVLGAVLHWPLVTAFLVVAAFLALAMLVLGEFQRWSETHSAPPGVLGFGFTRLPVATLLVIALVGGSFVLNDGSAHDVHRQGTLPAGLTGTAGRGGVDLHTALAEWVAGNCAGAGHAGAVVPLILVAAPGGGTRAAYWTASTLSDLFGPDRTARVPGCDAAPADRIFAMGGASGGSLGVLSYEAGVTSTRAKAWYDEQLGRPDFLTDPLTWLLTADLARAFIGFRGEDRARRLEDGFIRSVTGLDQDFFAGTWGLGGRSPLMLLTGTQVESGCRLNVSGLRLTEAGARKAGVGCATLSTGPGQTDAAVTSDLLDFLCDAGGAQPTSVSRATAALLSARFPYVSPSGQLYSCADPTVPGQPAHDATSTAIVDGGYAEDTGIGMLLSLWPRLAPLIAEHNADSDQARILPVFLEVENHYAQVAPPTERGRTVEGLVPPLTRGRPDQLDDRAEEQQAAATFDGTVPGLTSGCDLIKGGGRFLVISPLTSPGLPAPLAWTMSRLATDDLTAQRVTALAGAGPKAVAAWVSGTVACA